MPLWVAGDEGGTGRAHGARYKWDVIDCYQVIMDTFTPRCPFGVTLKKGEGLIKSIN